MINISENNTSSSIGYKTSVLIFALAILFWAIFDSTMQYITPLLIQQQGFSTSMIGLIIGFSSVVGAVFDFFIYKVFKNTDFRRLLLTMFAIGFFYPLILWQSKSIWLFLFAMSIWGMYYDLYRFSAFDFVARFVKRKHSASSFGKIQVFKSLGGIIAPIIIGFVVADRISWQPFMVGWAALLVALVFLLLLIYAMQQKGDKNNLPEPVVKKRRLILEFNLWRKLGGILRPVLVMAFYYQIIDSFFWTLIPLYALASHQQQYGGLFLAAYSLPALIAGWFVSRITRKYGKKRSAYVSLLTGSLILSLFFFINNPFALILCVFLSSSFIKFTHPVINSSFADYINDAPQVEIEIEALEDFSSNIGYIIGPIAAGIMADVFGMPAAFSVLGLIGAIVAAILLVFGPKYIIVNKVPQQTI